jgi:hypothetical protein
MSEALALYAPTGVLKPVGTRLWIADGGIIHFGLGGIKAPFTTRMSVVRLLDGDILVHSPIALGAELRAQIDELGPLRHIVAPNTLHYWWVPDWKAAYPEARVYAPAALEGHTRRPVMIDAHLLSQRSPWPHDFKLLVVEGGALTEAVLFHRPSRTLILTDLIENFEPGKIRNMFYRWLVRAAGAADPDGKAPIDMRLSFFRHRQALKSVVEEMLTWAPERIIIAHGRWYERNGIQELRRAFRWVL